MILNMEPIEKNHGILNTSISRVSTTHTRILYCLLKYPLQGCHRVFLCEHSLMIYISFTAPLHIGHQIPSRNMQHALLCATLFRSKIKLSSDLDAHRHQFTLVYSVTKCEGNVKRGKSIGLLLHEEQNCFSQHMGSTNTFTAVYLSPFSS